MISNTNYFGFHYLKVKKRTSLAYRKTNNTQKVFALFIKNTPFPK